MAFTGRLLVLCLWFCIMFCHSSCATSDKLKVKDDVNKLLLMNEGMTSRGYLATGLITEKMFALLAPMQTGTAIHCELLLASVTCWRHKIKPRTHMASIHSVQ